MLRIRQASSTPTDATLSALALSGVTLSPAFASATTTYTANGANGVGQTTVSPTVNDGGANYVIKLGGVTDADGTVDLAVGSNVITVEVTAEDGTTTKTYTVTVTRAAPSTDATLSALGLSGVTLSPAFASPTTAYTADVANDVEQTDSYGDGQRRRGELGSQDRRGYRRRRYGGPGCGSQRHHG